MEGENLVIQIERAAMSQSRSNGDSACHEKAVGAYSAPTSVYSMEPRPQLQASENKRRHSKLKISSARHIDLSGIGTTNVYSRTEPFCITLGVATTLLRTMNT